MNLLCKSMITVITLRQPPARSATEQSAWQELEKMLNGIERNDDEPIRAADCLPTFAALAHVAGFARNPTSGGTAPGSLS